MSETVSAAIDIQGAVVRYAEVERVDDGLRLLRLGSCDFAFDVAHALFHASSASRHVAQVRVALGDALDGLDTERIQVSMHPPDGYSFFTPLSAEQPVRDRKRQLIQQAALLTDTRSPKDLRLTSKTVRTAQDSEGEAIMWVHVLAVPETIDLRLSDALGDVSVERHEWMLSTEAASRVTSQTELTGITQEQALRPFTLAVGEFATHTEYTLARDRQWFHSHHSCDVRSSADRAYFGVALLNRLKVPLNAVGRFFVYGEPDDLDAYAPFQAIFGLPPEPLDPLAVVDVAPEDVTLDVDPGAYVPAVGAALT